MKPLSPRELQVATMAARGFNNHRIGQRLGIKQSTVKVIIAESMLKLNVRRRTLLPAALNLPLENAVDVELTPEQLEMALMISKGAGVREIADALSIPHATAKGRLQRIYATVGVDNMAGLAAWYLARHGRSDDAGIVPIGYRFYADHHDRRGEYVASPVWGVDRDDAGERRISTSTVWRDVNIDDRPDAVRFSDGSSRLLTAAEIGTWPNWRGA